MLGEMAALSASALWAIASLLFTRVGDRLSPGALNLTKTGLAMVLLVLTLWALKGSPIPQGMASDEIAWLAFSGLIGLTIGDTLMFLAFTRIGPRRTLLFLTLSPPLTALIAWPVLSEPISGGMSIGIALTIAGVGWVIAERNQASGPGDYPIVGYLCAAGAAFCQAAGNIATKLGGTHDALDLSVTRVFFGVCALVLMLALKEGFGPMRAALRDSKLLRTVVIATLLGTYLGIWLQVTGLRYTSAGIAATLSSTSPIFILPLSALFLGDRVGLRAIGGACLAVAGVAVLFVL